LTSFVFFFLHNRVCCASSLKIENTGKEIAHLRLSEYNIKINLKILKGPVCYAFEITLTNGN